jgi:hypothetical protein
MYFMTLDKINVKCDRISIFSERELQECFCEMYQIEAQKIRVNRKSW